MSEQIQAEVIITSHNNADFDALASMVAASQLYPGAVLVFPGSQERNLRNFFIESATYMFNFKNAKQIDPTSVKMLVLVDTRQYSRVPHIHHVLDRPGLTVHAYDHHPDTTDGDDIPYSKGTVNDWGSTTTILVHELMRKKQDVDPEVATVLGLGIFEDTGSFTFNSTTQQDFSAAAWLRGQGMDLNVVSDLITRELSSDQVAILSSLLDSATTHDIRGVQVVIAEATMEHYMGDFALLAHKLLDMENLRVLFAIGRMFDRIQVVARSRTPDVDVGQICTSLGGGGHTYAASASIRDRTITQVKDELFALLYSHINPQITVREIMSQPPMSVDDDMDIKHAFETINRFGLKAVPVVATGTSRCVGILEYGTAAKAMSHGLGGLRVAEYMQREFEIASRDSDLYPIMEIIVGYRQRLVPVVEEDRLVGVITRTDLINRLIEEPARIPDNLQPKKTRDRFIGSLLRERLPRPTVDLLHLAGELGNELGFTVYVVGGFVRDILLRTSNLDLDLVVEGNGTAFARALAEKLNGRVRLHHKFKTGVVLYKAKGVEKRVDVATARLEYYEYPAALPMVELSSIKMDLYRRDFTINSLAVQLNAGQFGKLVDFFGAQRDIKDRQIRVLHSLSFVEDPTRILRAIRFEQRYGFSIGGQTSRLIKNALQLKLIEKLSGSRILHELKLIMEEPSAPSCLRRMQQFGLLEAIHPVFTLRRNKEAVLFEVEKVMTSYDLLLDAPKPRTWMMYLMGLCTGASRDEAYDVADRLYLSRKAREEFVQIRSQVFAAADKLMGWARKKRRSMSALFEILDPLTLEGQLFLMARSRKEATRKTISHYLTRLKGTRVDITGDDLIEQLGLEPGPEFGVILHHVLMAKLDGMADNRAAQLKLATKLAQTIQDKQGRRGQVRLRGRSGQQKARERRRQDKEQDKEQDAGS